MVTTKLAFALNRLRSAVHAYTQAAQEERLTNSDLVELIRSADALSDHPHVNSLQRIMNIQQRVEQLRSLPVREDKLPALLASAHRLVERIDLLTDDLLVI